MEHLPTYRGKSGGFSQIILSSGISCQFEYRSRKIQMQLQMKMPVEPFFHD
jgi:hypothetical protein